MTDRDPGDVEPALADLTAVDRADVFKQGRLAARLSRSRDGVEFRYTDAWVEAGGAPVPTTSSASSSPSAATPSGTSRWCRRVSSRSARMPVSRWRTSPA